MFLEQKKPDRNLRNKTHQYPSAHEKGLCNTKEKAFCEMSGKSTYETRDLT